jgi:hypothetical protein
MQLRVAQGQNLKIGNDLGSLRAGHPNEHHAMRRNQSLKMLGEDTYILLAP